MSIQQAPLPEEVSIRSNTWNRWFQNIFNKLQNIDTQDTSTFVDINVTGDYQKDGSAGITEVLTFGGGASGEVATITVSGGIITARTLVP